MSRGQFITFEGGDGAGKTTLIESLHAHFAHEGCDVVHTRAPGGTGAGQVIRKLLLHPDDPLVTRAELLLFLADRAQQVEKVILPALSEGKVVLCDRYNDSTLAYQGIARGFPLSFVKEACAFATGGLKPDLTLYLDLDPSLGIQRVQKANDHYKDQIEKEDLSFHKRIREAFLSFQKEDPTRFQILDASKSKETVFQEALKLVQNRCYS